MNAQLTWLRDIRTRVPNCPACHGYDWVPGGLEPLMRLDDAEALPVTCNYCGHIALYSAKHLSDLSFRY